MMVRWRDCHAGPESASAGASTRQRWPCLHGGRCASPSPCTCLSQVCWCKADVDDAVVSPTWLFRIVPVHHVVGSGLASHQAAQLASVECTLSRAPLPPSHQPAGAGRQLFGQHLTHLGTYT